MTYLGMHLMTKSGNQVFGVDGPERVRMADVLRQAKITHVKLLCDSDSQVKAAKWLYEQGFKVIVRFYHQAKFPKGHPREGQFDDDCLRAVPDDQLVLYKPYVEAVEGYINEPEIEWGKSPTIETIDLLIGAWLRFADACGRVGITPITPAIQGDRVESWFEPFVARTIARGRKDSFDKCIIGVHPRPVNNLPSAPPPGFVARSYEDFEEVAIAYGIPTRMRATEWGYEPGDSQNQTLPKIDHQNHATYNVRLAQIEWRPCLEVVYYWTWLNDWSDSGWWRGSIEASLPVVKAFIDMLPITPPEPPVIPEPPDFDAAIVAAINQRMLVYPWGIKEAYRRGYVPFGNEVAVDIAGVRYYAQPARRPNGSLCILTFKAGDYTPQTTNEVEYKL